MKKNQIFHGLKRPWAKFLLVMRLCIFMSVVFTLTIQAKSFSQNSRVTLKMNNVSLGEVIKEIEEKTDFYFYFNVDLDQFMVDNIDLTDKEINQVLSDLLPGLGLEHKIVDQYIVIKQAEEGAGVNVQNQITISGTITDAKGEQIVGATIMVKGTTNGTISDITGSYTLANVPADAILSFSFIGMKTKEIPVMGKSKIDVQMEDESIGLDEVVAIGYGVVKKSDLTGAVGSVKSEDLAESATSSVMHMLSGKVAGLQISQTSSQPGGGVSVLIRGAASTGAGNSPLYVIDGFPVGDTDVEPGGSYDYGSRNPLNTINPNDIESIEVLKDASASAIYGARAANGVILITTKSAKEGSFDVEYNVSYGLQKPKNNFDLLSGSELMEVWNHAYREYYRYENNYYPYGDNGEAPADVFPEQFSAEDIANAETYDYEDMITRTGQLQEHNLVIKSGTKKAKVYSSFNYYDQEGMLTNLDFKRYTGRINLDYNLSDKFTVGTRMTAAFIKNSNSQMGGTNDNSGMISSAYQFPSFIAPMDESGEYNLNLNRPNIPNPLSFTEITDKTNTYKFLTSVYADYQFTSWLGAKVKYGVDYNKGKRKMYLPTSFLYGASVNGDASINQKEKTNELFEVTTTFNKSIDKLNLSGVLGFSKENYTSEGFYAQNNNFLTDLFLYNNLEAGTADRPSVSSGYGTTKFKSYFSRVSLNWDSKYLLTATIRGDGSDKFGENNKWGYFPSAALAWRVTEESFMDGFDKLSDLKLRVSYGQIGNANIGGSAFAYYNVGSNYSFGNSIVTGIEQSSLANPDLKWETTTEVNFGLDFGFFNNRIHGTAEVFQKTVEDLLSYRALASYFPISSIAANVGSTQSKGWEMTLSTRNVDNGTFSWDTNISLGHYEDRWKKRNPEVILPVYKKEDDPIYAIYGYLSDGILQVGEEYSENESIIPGEIKVKDINGLDEEGNLTGKPDGKINDADRVLLGTSQPKLNFGISNTFKYKNVDLSINIYGMLDRDIFDYNKRNLGVLERVNNTTSLTYKAWSSENQDGTLPSGIKSTYSGNSDFYRTNVDFARIKNITLGYTFNPELLKLTNVIKKARLFVDFSNVAVFSNYDGGDPETDSWAAYPFPFSVTFGANLNF